MESLRDKVLIMIVGPAAIGKSTLMDTVAATDGDFSYVRSFTTRTKRPGETSHYDFVSLDQVRALHSAGKTVTYFEHPTTHNIYGTTAASFPTRYNVLDTLSGSVHLYRSLPFERTITISLTAPLNEWQQWFLGRYPEKSEEALKRLKEAKLSISWSLTDNDIYWLENPAGDLEATTKQLIDIVRNIPTHSPTPKNAHDMLDLIEKGMWRDE